MGSTPRTPCTRFTRACDYWNWGPDAVRPACCTEHLLELIGFTSELLARRGVVHWLDFGTLLGAVREGELIPWDGDADFSVMQSQEQAVLALADEFGAAGHRLDTSHHGLIRILYSKANAAQLDLFMWETREGTLIPLDTHAWPGMASRLAFPERFIAPLGEVSLHGRAYPAPAHVHEFLREHRYGPDYAKPRPPIKSAGLYQDFDIDESTPEIERLVERIGAGDRRLGELRSRSRFSHHRPFELWQKAGLPISPDDRRVQAVLAEGPAESPTEALEGLARSLALVEQAVAEHEHPTPELAIKRMRRRLRRIAEVLLARAQRRPHRAGFPFGVEPMGEPG
jgi:hypothetical protein